MQPSKRNNKVAASSLKDAQGKPKGKLRGRRGSYVIQRFCVSSRAARGGFVPLPPVPPSRPNVTSLFWPPRSTGLWLGCRTCQRHAVSLAIGRFRARRNRKVPSRLCSLAGTPATCARPLTGGESAKVAGVLRFGRLKTRPASVSRTSTSFVSLSLLW